MAIRMTQPFTYSIERPGMESIARDGRQDARWNNSIPPRFRASIEVEFDGDQDIEQLRAVLQMLGGDLPRR